LSNVPNAKQIDLARFWKRSLNEIAAMLAVALCLAGAGELFTSYAQQETNTKMAAEKSRGGKLYRQNCASCHEVSGAGRDACCMMMSGPNLLSAVLRMNANSFYNDVRHVGKTNMCAGQPAIFFPEFSMNKPKVGSGSVFSIPSLWGTIARCSRI
jgi:mono/diheme cytochrome c family protein